MHKSSYIKAARIYKYVESNSKDSELRGQALFNLGLLYHFGSNSLYTRASSGAETAQADTNPRQTQHFSHLGQAQESDHVIKIDLTQAQKFYQQALKEESKAQAPVYLLYVYSKWQSIDLYESLYLGLLINGILQSPGNQLKILLGLLAYFGMLGATVKYLRREQPDRVAQPRNAEAAQPAPRQ